MQLRMVTLSRQLFCGLTSAAVAFVSTSHATDKEYGVYEFVVRKAVGTFDQATSGLQDAAVKAGWLVVATVDAGKMDRLHQGRIERTVDLLAHVSTIQGGNQ